MWNNQYEKMPTLVALGMRVYDMLILLRTSWQTIKDCSYTQSSKLKFRSGYWVFCRKDPRWHCEPKSNNLFCSILGQPSLHHNPIIMASGASLLEIYNLRIYVPNPMLKECGGQGHAHFSPASASTPAQGLRIGVDLVARDHAPGWSARLPVWSEVWSLKVKTCAFLYQFKWWTQCHSNDGFFGETCPIFHVIILYLSVELGTKLTKVAEVEKYFSPWIPTQHRNAASFKLDSTMVYSTPGIPQVYVSPMEPLLGRSSGNCCFIILWSTSKKSMSHGVTGDYHPQIMQEFIRIWPHQLVSGSDFTWASKPTSGALRWALGFACAIAEGFNWEATEIGHRGTARMVLDSGLKCLAIPAKQTSHLSFFVGKEMGSIYPNDNFNGKMMIRKLIGGFNPSEKPSIATGDHHLKPDWFWVWYRVPSGHQTWQWKITDL